MKRLAVLFPGQGSQYNGMMKEDYERYSVVRQTFEEASDTLGYDMAALCFHGGEEKLAQSDLTQPALLTAGVASYRLFVQETGIRPAAAAGHSLGEYTALTCAGVLKYCDALQLVRERGRLMMEASASGLGRMLAVSGITEYEAANMLERMRDVKIRPVISCYNSSKQIVLSGTTEAVTAAEELLAAEGVKLSSLKVSGAFHSPLMAEAANELEERLRRYEFGAFTFPVISNIQGEIYGANAEEIIGSLKRQMTEPVRWRQSIACLLKRSMDAVVELAPRKTLARLLKEDYPAFPAYSMDDQTDRQVVFSPSFKANYQYTERRVLEEYLAIAVSTRNHCHNEQVYQEQVVAPYRQLEGLLLNLEHNNAEPSAEQLREAWNWLKSIVNAKGAEIEDYGNPFETEGMFTR
ncbi:ACP S-malonyltransferase [Paenibacillus sp. Marseille-P2973]|uniref:ACP S-malonyltransferase n=1 Tax=Paenibacillus sp. Marseille-P2973 TaxID=1871032 RepID=UPI001B381BF1|nr:ACP S-malonyltransferase [Paenibacillus sp. Marseille-P2973]MBQ4899274.1 ACP S-malonyltransferase [Paenibacillus sp. Marseille-P2973]